MEYNFAEEILKPGIYKGFVLASESVLLALAPWITMVLVFCVIRLAIVKIYRWCCLMSGDTHGEARYKSKRFKSKLEFISSFLDFVNILKK